MSWQCGLLLAPQELQLKRWKAVGMHLIRRPSSTALYLVLALSFVFRDYRS
jgi:hypothetical protein